MKGRTHLAIGLGIGAVASVNQSLEMIPVILTATGVASLAPDLDGNNLLNKRVTKTAKLIKKQGVIAGVALMILSLITYFLELNMRANETDNDNAFAVDSNKKSIKALKSIMGLLEGNKISVIQINWYLPSKSLVNAESIYYILRFDTKTLLSIDWNTVDENNLTQYTSYVSEDYKKIN